MIPGPLKAFLVPDNYILQAQADSEKYPSPKTFYCIYFFSFTSVEDEVAE